MKNILLTLIILTLISCNQLTKKVESSFSTIGIKLDSLNKIEENKIEKHFNEINSKRIKKYLEKKKIVGQFEYAKTDLRNKLNTITEFNTKAEVDSLLKPSKDLEILPNFAIISEFQSGKLNSTKSAELLLKKLNDKTKNEKELNKN